MRPGGTTLWLHMTHIPQLQLDNIPCSAPLPTTLWSPPPPLLSVPRYFMEDDTLEIIEPQEPNSGLPQV